MWRSRGTPRSWIREHRTDSRSRHTRSSTSSNGLVRKQMRGSATWTSMLQARCPAGEDLAQIPGLSGRHVLHQAQEIGAGRRQRSSDVVLRQAVQLPDQGLARSLQLVLATRLGVVDDHLLRLSCRQRGGDRRTSSVPPSSSPPRQRRVSERVGAGFAGELGIEPVKLRAQWGRAVGTVPSAQRFVHSVQHSARRGPDELGPVVVRGSENRPRESYHRPPVSKLFGDHRGIEV